MIIFIELVKRVSILHEKFFIYKKHFTNNTILYNTYSPTKQYKQLNNSPNKQYFQNTTKLTKLTKQPNNQTTKQTNNYIS